MESPGHLAPSRNIIMNGFGSNNIVCQAAATPMLHRVVQPPTVNQASYFVPQLNTEKNED